MLTLSEWLQDQELTDNIDEAIFILENGQMVSGDFDMGMRGLDHNCIICLAPSELSHNEKWNHIHSVYNVVRLVPETKEALITGVQILSSIQKQLLKDSNYKISVY